MRFTKLIVVAALLAACAPAPRPAGPAAEDAEDAGPFSVILLIGDGAGLNYWSAAKMAFPDVAVEQLPSLGLVGTQASNNYITDSAAGATAFSAGVKTFNGAIGVGPDSAVVETVLERAHDRGKATGLVATSTITHATPASFAAHVPSRSMHFDIAAQMAEADVDVLIGGGRRYFDPAERPDGRDLLAELAEGHTVTDSAAAFLELDVESVERLVAFTADDSPPGASARSLTLSQMTETALSVLERDDDGFFLMVEGSQIDWRGHDNAPLNAVLGELLDFDQAIRVALDFQQQRPNTLIVVVADHETGGMALHYDEMGVFRTHYTTDSHTAGMVPLFAGGPGAASLSGIQENDRVGRVLLELVDRDGRAVAP